VPLPSLATALRPPRPELLRGRDLALDLDRFRRFEVRLVPREFEGHDVALTDLEVGDRREILTARRDRRPQTQRLGPRDEGEAVVRAAHPRRDGSVVEADAQ